MECGMRKYCYDKCPYFRMYFIFSEVGDLYAIGCMQGECWNARAKGYTPESAEASFARVEVGGIVKKPYVTNLCTNEKTYNWRSNSFRCKAGEIPSELWLQTHMYMQYRDCVLDNDNRECIFHAERKLDEWNEKE